MDAQIEAIIKNQQTLSGKGNRNVEMLSSGEGEDLDFSYDEMTQQNIGSG